MNAVSAVVLGLLGAVAGVPLAAVALRAAATGPIELPPRWWTVAPARPAAVATTSAMAGIAAAIPGAVLAATPALIAFWVFAVIGVGLAVIDSRCHRLPHSLTAMVSIVALLCFTIVAILDNASMSLLRAVGAAIVTAVLLLVVALARPGQLGLGDVAFASAAALTLGWLSWPAAAAGLVLGIGLQAVLILVMQRRHSHARYPWGPALLAGWALAVALMGSGP